MLQNSTTHKVLMFAKFFKNDFDKAKISEINPNLGNNKPTLKALYRLQEWELVERTSDSHYRITAEGERYLAAMAEYFSRRSASPTKR